MDTGEIMELTNRHVMQTYGRLPLALVRGEGCRVWDADGREYLDFVGGLAVNGLGHRHPAVVAAIRDAADQLLHCSNLYYIEPQARLARFLTEQSGLDRAFFCNSGAEANEAAIKLARRWAYEQGKEDKVEIVAALNSFHGRTLATVTATGQPKYHQGFAPLPAGFRHVPLNDLQALQEVVSDATCAVLLEPIQGEGGVHPCTPEYLQGAAELCRRHDALLMLDEVQTGLGRTGRMFAFQHYDVQPDVITVAKSLGGGIPIGAMLAREQTAAALSPGTHATTFGGNPFACRVALGAMGAVMEDGLVERAELMGSYFMDLLENLQERFPQLGEIRGKGLMIGLDTSLPAGEIMQAAMRRGLLINAIGDNVLRFLPPLIITQSEIDQAVEVLEAAVSEVARAAAQAG